MSDWKKGTEVHIIKGAYKDMTGMVVAETPKKLKVKFTNEEATKTVLLSKESIIAFENHNEEEDFTPATPSRPEKSHTKWPQRKDSAPPSPNSNKNMRSLHEEMLSARGGHGSKAQGRNSFLFQIQSLTLGISSWLKGLGTLILKIPHILSSNILLLAKSFVEFLIVFVALFSTYFLIRTVVVFLWTASGIGNLLLSFVNQVAGLDSSVDLGIYAERLTTIADLGAFPLGWMALREQYNFDQYWVTSYYKFERVNCSLNFFARGENGKRSLRFRTLFETLPQDFLNRDLLEVMSEAQEKTTTEDPFVDMNEGKDRNFQEAFNKQLVNYISALAASRWIDIAQASTKASYESGYRPVPTVDLIFGLTYEVNPHTPLRKPRIMLIEETTLQEIVEDKGTGFVPEFEAPSHKPRWETLKAMASIYVEEDGPFGGHLTRLGRVSWPKLE
eukprot:m.58932 g.58932  ORF g.58932 m.58932 type:complete len:445 (+) comp11206_c0_seq7:127-1461(+)